MDEKFEIEVQKYLRREELKYRAKEKPNGSYCDWLARSCGSVDDIVAMLRWLGFRIKDVTECDGAEWVETTSGVMVFVNFPGGQGFVMGRSK